MHTDKSELLRIKVVADPSLEALIRVLQCLEGPDALPVRISAVRGSVRGGSREVLEIDIETEAADLAPDAFRLLLAKINQLPLVFTTAS
jgi:hypothetical protein